jgi:hypothetical protein
LEIIISQRAGILDQLSLSYPRWPQEMLIKSKVAKLTTWDSRLLTGLTRLILKDSLEAKSLIIENLRALQTNACINPSLS